MSETTSKGTPVPVDEIGPRQVATTATLYGKRAPLFLRMQIGEGEVPDTPYRFKVEMTMSGGTIIVRLCEGDESIGTAVVAMDRLVTDVLDTMMMNGAQEAAPAS